MASPIYIQNFNQRPSSNSHFYHKLILRADTSWTLRTRNRKWPIIHNSFATNTKILTSCSYALFKTVNRIAKFVNTANKKSLSISHTIPTTFLKSSNSLTSTNQNWSSPNCKKVLPILKLLLLSINFFIKNKFKGFQLISTRLSINLLKPPMSTKEFISKTFRKKSAPLTRICSTLRTT